MATKIKTLDWEINRFFKKEKNARVQKIKIKADRRTDDKNIENIRYKFNRIKEEVFY